MCVFNYVSTDESCSASLVTRHSLDRKHKPCPQQGKVNSHSPSKPTSAFFFLSQTSGHNVTKWRLGKPPQLLLGGKKTKTNNKNKTEACSPSAVCAWVVSYLHIHKDFGLSFGTESQKGRGAGSLNSKGCCIQCVCISAEESNLGESCLVLHTDSRPPLRFSASFSSTGHFCPTSVDMKPPFFSILPLIVLIIQAAINFSSIPVFQHQSLQERSSLFGK